MFGSIDEWVLLRHLFSHFIQLGSFLRDSVRITGKFTGNSQEWHGNSSLVMCQSLTTRWLVAANLCVYFAFILLFWTLNICKRIFVKTFGAISIMVFLFVVKIILRPSPKQGWSFCDSVNVVAYGIRAILELCILNVSQMLDEEVGWIYQLGNYEWTAVEKEGAVVVWIPTGSHCCLLSETFMELPYVTNMTK